MLKKLIIVRDSKTILGDLMKRSGHTYKRLRSLCAGISLLTKILYTCRHYCPYLQDRAFPTNSIAWLAANSFGAVLVCGVLWRIMC